MAPEASAAVADVPEAAGVPEAPEAPEVTKAPEVYKIPDVPEVPEPLSPVSVADSSPAHDDTVVPVEESWEAQRQKIPLNVEVEWLDFEHFKNRYSEKDGLAIIEVLCGHANIAQEVAKESARRARGRRDIRVPTPVPANLKQTVDGDSYWMQRVRIQSPQLILLLSRLTGHRDKWGTDRPRTFFAPFRGFHYYLSQLKQSLKLLESKWTGEDALEHHEAQPTSPTSPNDAKAEYDDDRRDDGSDSDSSSDSGDDDDAANAESGPMTPELAVTGGIVDSRTTMAHLEKLIEFTEKHIEPHWHRAAGTSQRKFRFSDLWMAFQPGELLHVPMSSETPQNAEATQGSSPKMYQTSWRLYSLVLDPLKDDKPNDTHKVTKRELDVYGYYLDYDGTSYVPVRHTFSIKDYEGERDITTLEVYPLRFAKDADKTKDTLSKQGAWFGQVVTELKHLTYDGWTLTHGPTGTTSESEKPLAVEHIEGDVIIDFVEGYKSEPMLSLGPSSWNRGLSEFEDVGWPSGDDDMYIWHWTPIATNSARLEWLADIREKTQRGEWFGDKLKQEQIEKRPVLKANEEEKPVKGLEDDELLLLPRRVVAYAFRERRFVMLDIQSLKELPAADNVFKDLRIDPSHKAMVISLVKSHLDKQAAQKLRPSVSLNQDLIRGKGSGLVILLHGVPGVGKTATAEAVAQANRKPLFVITCGDLGFTPKDVENALKDIFRLAHLWDCILLLDEADIFLSRRELGDLKRNALVSVFLRVLEYYSGILFLTTNRVGTLDEAFKSRIHVSLYYPRLNKRQTIEIFKVNIRKLHKIAAEKHRQQTELQPDGPTRPRLMISQQSILHYAEWHYDTHEETPEQRWNGRQIRNAFQIAYSLAEYDILDQEDQTGDEIGFFGDVGYNTPRPKVGDGRLDWRQFDMVARAIEKFEDYLVSATNGTDGDRARKSFIRQDDYDERNTPQKPAYNPPSYQQRARPPPPGGRRPGPGPNSAANFRPSYRPPPEERPRYRPPVSPRTEQSTPVRNTAYPPRQQAAAHGRSATLTVPGAGPSGRGAPRRLPGSGPGPGPGFNSAGGGPPPAMGRGGAGRGRSAPISPASAASSMYSGQQQQHQQSAQQPKQGGGGGGGGPPSSNKRNDSGYASHWSATTPRTPGGAGSGQEGSGSGSGSGSRVEGGGGWDAQHHEEAVVDDGEGEDGLYMGEEAGHGLDHGDGGYDDFGEDEGGGGGYYGGGNGQHGGYDGGDGYEYAGEGEGYEYAGEGDGRGYEAEVGEGEVFYER